MTRNAKIGEFLKESRIPGSTGSTAKKITVKLYGKGVFAKQENRPGSENTSYYKRKAGQFIYSKLDFLNGAFGIIPEALDGYESTVDLPCFDFISSEVSPEWFLQFVSRSDFYSYQGGLGNGGRKARRISPDDFLDLEIEIPPLPEQKKIAEILSGIDRAIDARKNSEKAIAQIGNFVAEELLQRASADHDLVKIKDCTCRLWQGINTAADKVEYHDRGVPILQAKHVTSGRIDSKGARHLSEKDYERYSERYQPQKGDILFTNIGTIGKSALVTDRSRFLIAWNIFLITPSEEIISEYMQYYLQSLDRRNYFHEHAAGNATKFINKTLISELEIPLPPKEKQIKICNQIRAMIKTEENERNVISKYLELKRSLLLDLLSGRKRVSV